MEEKTSEAYMFVMAESIIEEKLKKEYLNVFDRFKYDDKENKMIDIKGNDLIVLENAINELIDKIKYEYYHIGKMCINILDRTKIDTYVKNLSQQSAGE